MSPRVRLRFLAVGASDFYWYSLSRVLSSFSPSPSVLHFLYSFNRLQQMQAFEPRECVYGVSIGRVVFWLVCTVCVWGGVYVCVRVCVCIEIIYT